MDPNPIENPESLQLPQLNLPPCNLQLRHNTRGRVEVYDIFRGKWVALTPEEHVRQSFLRYLVGTLGYSPYKLAVESGLVINGTRRRFDALAFDDYGCPVAVIEFKAPEIAISQSTFNQIVRYNMVIHAPVLIVSNGIKHYCCSIDTHSGKHEFLSRIPHYAEIRNITRSRTQNSPDNSPDSQG